jgi:putative NIF3 family GTP cyclohydrolase 1 type 2
LHQNVLSVKIAKVVNALEQFAPLPLQEDYDNAGLQTGLTEADVSGALLCLDVTEAVVDEAVAKGLQPHRVAPSSDLPQAQKALRRG